MTKFQLQYAYILGIIALVTTTVFLFLSKILIILSIGAIAFIVGLIVDLIIATTKSKPYRKRK